MSVLKFNPNSTIIVVKSKIETTKGIEYADMVFDTGASLVMLPWNLVVAVGLKIDPKKTIKTTTASTVETSPLTRIPRLSVLGHSVKNVDCLVRDLPQESKIDGLLGLSFLRYFNIDINFEKGMLALTSFSP